MSKTYSLLNGAPRRLIHLAAGETLFAAGDETRGFFHVESGRIRLVRVNKLGRETLLFTARPGSSFAEASLFADVYHCDALAAEPSVVTLTPKREALALLRSDPDKAERFMADLAHLVMSLRADLAMRDIRKRGRSPARLPDRDGGRRRAHRSGR